MIWTYERKNYIYFYRPGSIWKEIEVGNCSSPICFSVVKSRKSDGQDYYICNILYAITSQKINNIVIVFIVPL